MVSSYKLTSCYKVVNSFHLSDELSKLKAFFLCWHIPCFFKCLDLNIKCYLKCLLTMTLRSALSRIQYGRVLDEPSMLRYRRAYVLPALPA